jgi:type I restriction enzyme S subunit
MFDEMNNLANGAAQQNLSPIRTGQIKITVPSADILKMFENRISPLISRMLILWKQNKYLIQFRNRLLPKLMNGEILA